LLAPRFAWMGYVRAFAEAAMVGACADWFAVTALFRRPFGLPIPHTGLVPRNKERIGEALGGFIAENFLTADVLDVKLRQLELANWGASWLREPRNATQVAEGLVALVTELLALSTPGARRRFVTAIALDAIDATPAGPFASSVLRVFWTEARGPALIDRGLDLAADFLAANQEQIRSEIAGKTFVWLPRWLDRKIADKVLAALDELITELRQADHPWRSQIAEAVSRFIDRLDSDPELAARAEAIKRDLMDHPLLRTRLEQVSDALEARFRPQTPQATQALIETIAERLVGLGAWLEARSDARDIFNDWARMAVRHSLSPRRYEIGRFIADVVAGWDSTSIVEKLELRVGGDLQYIRINGTLVGGLVGLAIYIVAGLLHLG
jgi:uncharacterized membrane-anchored protein YjiN (DUF445 family)